MNRVDLEAMAQREVAAAAVLPLPHPVLRQHPLPLIGRHERL